MNLPSAKIKITRQILETESPVLLNHIQSIINSYKTDLWDELSVEQKESVRKAQLQLKNGQGKSHQLVMKKYKKWLSK